jgi:hypothetical protein
LLARMRLISRPSRPSRTSRTYPLLLSIVRCCSSKFFWYLIRAFAILLRSIENEDADLSLRSMLALIYYRYKIKHNMGSMAGPPGFMSFAICGRVSCQRLVFSRPLADSWFTLVGKGVPEMPPRFTRHWQNDHHLSELLIEGKCVAAPEANTSQGSVGMRSRRLRLTLNFQRLTGRAKNHKEAENGWADAPLGISTI